MSIRFGVCADLNYIDDVKAAGYDYIELSLCSIIKLNDKDFTNVVKTVNESGILAESYNGFFSPEFTLIGEKTDYDFIAAYAEKGLERAARLGGKLAVIGSGKARNVPDNFDYETAYRQFGKIVSMCGDIAAKYGMYIVVEPLNTKETNLINTVAQGLEFCNKLKHPNVKCLVDFYHAFQNNESMSAVRSAGKMLAHAHIARANADRNMPATDDDIYACQKWAQVLKDCGYSGRLSLEGNFGFNFAETINKTRKILDFFN